MRTLVTLRGTTRRCVRCTPPSYSCFKIKEILGRRGPDNIQEINTALTEDWAATMVGSVLWTQGPQPTPQPLQDSDGNYLLWNGDILFGELEDDKRCDSEVMFERLKTDPITAVTVIGGPCSLVFWHSGLRQLWFGRDVLGRHSLLWKVSSHHLCLTSTAHRHSDMVEVPALGFFMADLSSGQDIDIQFFPWAHLGISFSTMSDVPVVEKGRLIHNVVGGCRWWLGREPEEEDLAAYAGSFTLERLLARPAVLARVEDLLAVLAPAVECRVHKQPAVCKDCSQQCEHCSVAVLFSGGLDSTVLALLVDSFLFAHVPIDLYNVAFQLSNGSFQVPDRVTGLASLEELKKLAPDRIWNFVQIDVSQEELTSLRSSRVADLIYPLASVLDDSLGSALWFAARGQGHLNGQPYISPARVVVSGLGADEQLGGYTRHRNTLRHTQQWAAVGLELAADTDNIARRNLGRDDRVVSDHGRQLRVPFLDERVVKYINSLPPWHRCQPTGEGPPGLGDKLLLRLLARHLGLGAVAELPKRALQFGSRIANRKEKGSQISQRL